MVNKKDLDNLKGALDWQVKDACVVLMTTSTEAANLIGLLTPRGCYLPGWKAMH